MSDKPPTPLAEAASPPKARVRAVSGLMQAAHEGIIVIDGQQRIVAFNPAAERIFACTAEQALGQSIDCFLPPDSRDVREKLVEHAACAVRNGHTQTPLRLRALRADGTDFPVEISLSAVDLAVDGRAQRLVAALVHDLASEQALRDEIERLNLRLGVILELAPVAIWVAEDDRIVFANRAATALFAQDAGGELVGRLTYDLVQPHARDALKDQVARALLGETALPPVAAHMVTTSTDPNHQRELEIAVAALPDHGQTVVQMVVADVTQRRREAAELRRSRRTLRAFSASVVDAREKERQRIARELHDELGQRLSALKLEMAACATSLGLNPSAPELQNMLAMLDETMASVRRIAADLRPQMLDDLGLAAAVEWLAAEATLRLGVRVKADVAGLAPEPTEPVAIAAYRMVQEALTNSARHARATQVNVSLRCCDGELRLIVQDDGVGLTLPAAGRPGSYGLLGMQERAQLLGGRMQIDNAPGGGVCLRVFLPLYGGRPADTAPGDLP